jgi:hypothetical protein
VAVNEISNTFIRTFESNVIHLVQQKTSKLRRTVTEKSPGASEKHAFRVVGKGGALAQRANVGAIAGKRPATSFEDTVFNDRVAIPGHYGKADSYSQAEVLRMITDPESALTQKHAGMVGRTFDDVIIAALFANAPDSAGNANAFPAGNQLGGAAQAPTFALVKGVREAALEKDIDPDEEMFFVVSPNFAMALLDDAKATSYDYANAKALMSGSVVQGWMGFTWIVTNRLTKAVVGPPAQIYGAAYTKDAMGLITLQDATTEVGKDPGTWFDTIVQTTVDTGAVRIQDEKVFRVHYLESN